MNHLIIILLAVVAGAGGVLSGKIYFSRTQTTGDEAKKERLVGILLSCIISLLVGVSLFLLDQFARNKEIWYVLTLLVTIVFSGALGGLIGFFYRSVKNPISSTSLSETSLSETSPSETSPSENAVANPRSMCVSIIMGVGAALLVPVLLHILSSNLLSEIRINSEKIFILLGFCLAASISSDVFIYKIINQVNNNIGGDRK